MAEIIRMPKMSDTMTEGVIAKWHKKVGDKIKSGELIADIETDKTTMEFESFQEGTLLYIGVKEGTAVPVDGVIAVMGKEGEDYSALLKEAEIIPIKEIKKSIELPSSEPKNFPASKTNPSTLQPFNPSTKSNIDINSERIKVSPLARKLAGDRGIDLNKVQGSGDHGRIVKQDIEWFKSALASKIGATEKVVSMEEGFDDVPVSQMRKTIARRLSESKFSAPHFYLTMEMDMLPLNAAREAINEIADIKISYNDLIIKACASALRRHPNVNASWLDEEIRYYHHIHIGVAVAVEEGLLVPVVRFADQKTLSQIGKEVKDFSLKAKDKKLQPADWEGNTFTISNLGMFGIDEFTAIINTPDACILAVGAIKDVPVISSGQIVPGKQMKVTLSCDHRVVDGAKGAAFLQTLKYLIENPVILLGQDSI